jgi:hypothetical protein
VTVAERQRRQVTPRLDVVYHRELNCITAHASAIIAHCAWSKVELCNGRAARKHQGTRCACPYKEGAQRLADRPMQPMGSPLATRALTQVMCKVRQYWSWG